MRLGSSRTLTYPTEATTVLAFRERTPDAPRPPRLLERVRIALRARHASRRTEKAYVGCGSVDL